MWVCTLSHITLYGFHLTRISNVAEYGHPVRVGMCAGLFVCCVYVNVAMWCVSASCSMSMWRQCEVCVSYLLKVTMFGSLNWSFHLCLWSIF